MYLVPPNSWWQCWRTAHVAGPTALATASPMVTPAPPPAPPPAPNHCPTFPTWSTGSQSEARLRSMRTSSKPVGWTSLLLLLSLFFLFSAQHDSTGAATQNKKLQLTLCNLFLSSLFLYAKCVKVCWRCVTSMWGAAHVWTGTKPCESWCNFDVI